MARSPGLRPFLRALKTPGQIFLLLIGADHFNAPLGTDPANTIADHFVEKLLNIISNNKNDPVEARIQCVIDRIVHNTLATGTDTLELFDTALEPCANARGKDH